MCSVPDFDNPFEDIFDAIEDIFEGIVDIVEDIVSWLIPIPELPDFDDGFIPTPKNCVPSVTCS